ncbi:hypothetical protein [Sphingomonas sp. 28-62-11]|uniref:hypothetical protein n=1 Tax=Sphingomonas sp. 28-62-11 TaxID=1970432 RepID=UPI000BD5D96F|nr:MAG: hypothetical protein B7Y49_13430 [Sphingomonas sp. 28-62-11]
MATTGAVAAGQLSTPKPDGRLSGEAHRSMAQERQKLGGFLSDSFREQGMPKRTFAWSLDGDNYAPQYLPFLRTEVDPESRR